MLFADDFFLTHKSNFLEVCALGNERRWVNGCGARYGASSDPSPAFRQTNGKVNRGQVCNYCRTSGHWKNRCPVLEAKLSSALVCSNVSEVRPPPIDYSFKLLLMLLFPFAELRNLSQ